MRITRLTGVPVVLVLVGDRDRVGGMVTVRRLLVWETLSHVKGKPLSGLFPDRGGDVLGRRSLLEGAVVRLSRSSLVLRVKT